MHRMIGLAGVLLLLVSGSLAFADKKNDEESKQRTVQGTVTDAQDAGVDNAVVYLKNTKTLQIRTFFTKNHGAYVFHALNPDVDYELHAEYQGAASPNKKLSAFDSRKQAIINLKLGK